MKKRYQLINCLNILPRFIWILLFSTLVSLQVYSQKDTIDVPSDIPPVEGNLNTAVKNVIKAGTLSNTVFRLEPYGYYVLTETIEVPKGETLIIIAPEPGMTQETAPPQIMWSSNIPWNINEAPKTQFNFLVYGNITLKNIWLRYANTAGDQIGSCLHIAQDSTLDKQYGIFEGVIFNYSPCPQNVASGAVSVANNHFVGKFKNCYFKNCIDGHFRYYGRAVSFPYYTKGYHIDSLWFENCTFANIGYVVMQEGDEYSDNVHINHCTFFNVVMYVLESGWWHRLALTNSIFLNTNMYGDIPAMSLYDGGEPYGGMMRIDSISSFGFEVPFTEQDRRILVMKNSYHLEEWFRDWMYNNRIAFDLRREGRDDEIPVPQPMLSPGTLKFFDSVDVNGNKLFPYMNRADLYDAADPGFILPPSDTSAMKGFFYHKWWDGGDTSWAWKPGNDLDRKWPLEEDLSYSNKTLLEAGMNGFPLGDLYRWFPEKYTQWEAQKINEDNNINLLLNGLPSAVEDKPFTVSEFKLSQNYPNPFNPTTTINFFIPHSSLLRGVRGVLVTLKVYDILGREITTLVNEEKAPGTYTVKFDGSNLASGIYFYQLKAQNFIESKKFVLQK